MGSVSTGHHERGLTELLHEVLEVVRDIAEQVTRDHGACRVHTNPTYDGVVSRSTLLPELLELTGGDAHVRAAALALPADTTARVLDRGAVWSRPGHDGSGLRLSGVGEPGDAADLALEIAGTNPVARDGASTGDSRLHASLPAGWVSSLPEGFASVFEIAVGRDWDWMWTEDAPPAQPAEEAVSWLGNGDEQEIRSLLHEVSPGASTWPGDDRARRWAGLRAPDGRLAAILADTSRHDAVGEVSSVATAYGYRGRGYAAALVAWTTRRFFVEGAELATLGMYADNATARRLYERLGYHCDHHFTGATLVTARPVRDHEGSPS